MNAFRQQLTTIASELNAELTGRGTIDIPHTEVNTITYKDFEITEHGSRFTATYPGGAEVKLRGDEDLEEVKELIDWLAIEMECETADINDGLYYGKHWNEDKI